jgi:endonuclease/exonuclease/phosphatase family metal-dependent hydrolase
MKTKPALSLLTVLFLAGCTTLPDPDLEPSGPSLRVVTYNVNWGCTNPGQVTDFLSESKADIIFLQETHRRWEDFLQQHLSETYPYASFHAASGAGGIGFLSKQPLHNVKLLDPQAGWFPALLAEITTDIGPVQLLNVHLRPPLSDRGSATPSAYLESSEIHTKELSEFLQATDEITPLILAGDFNENEHRKAVNKLLNNGFTSALPMYDTKSKTWAWPVFPGFTLKNRYDHILFSKQLHCTGAKVTDVPASDHRPVMAVLTRKDTL